MYVPGCIWNDIIHFIKCTVETEGTAVGNKIDTYIELCNYTILNILYMCHNTQRKITLNPL